jgi:hypothetical protein
MKPTSHNKFSPKGFAMKFTVPFRIVAMALSLAIFSFFAAPSPAHAQISVGIAVHVAPPELPVYEQPICPGDDYIWTPGYWAWDGDDYYWVPGTWVLAPEPGYFWTPGYWGWGDSGYVFTAGYWGPVVGFYGGIDYGFGYFGHGYVGGRWQGGHFFYNTEVSRVNVTVIHNTYVDRNVVVNRSTGNRVSFNGGNGGIQARADAQEEAAQRDRHIGAVAAQNQQAEAARSNRDLRASVNHGAPPIAATAKPGAFSDQDVAHATNAGSFRGAPDARGNNVPNNAPSAGAPNGGAPGGNRAIHPRDLPPAEKAAPPSTGDTKLDQKFQSQQNKLSTKQAQDYQKLQQRQDKQDQALARKNANDTARQQMEQQHAQQTQVMQQRHTQQSQNLAQHQQAHAPAQHGGGGGQHR